MASVSAIFAVAFECVSIVRKWRCLMCHPKSFGGRRLLRPAYIGKTLRMGTANRRVERRPATVRTMVAGGRAEWLRSLLQTWQTSVLHGAGGRSESLECLRIWSRLALSPVTVAAGEAQSQRMGVTLRSRLGSVPTVSAASDRRRPW
jgi:hypothetical protein